MSMTSMARSLVNNYNDARSFGLGINKRHWHKLMVALGSKDRCFEARTKLGPIYMRPHHSDMSVLRKIYAEKEYDLSHVPQGRRVHDAYSLALRRGRTPLIIDAGANIGFASRFFASTYPEARVMAVEPDPANAAICRQNTKAFPQIEVVEAAIGARSGFVSVESKHNEGYATRTHRATSGVPVVTVGELKSRVENSELIIVKVDIEGFELDLFSGDTEWVAESCAVIVEPHDWMLPGRGSSRTMQQTMMAKDREMLIVGENIVWIKNQDAEDHLPRG